MSACSFDRLLQFVNTQLDLDGQLEIYDHLDRCDICLDAVRQLSRERREKLFPDRARRGKPSILQQPLGAAVRSPCA